jgi:peptidoglycan hydrolase-like protein with peptidoglycan-binding domain
MLNIIETYIELNGELKYGNRPLFIIIYDSGISGKSVYDLDEEDKYRNGKSMFGGHFYVTRDGLIFRGRPFNSYGDFAKNEETGMTFNTNSIGICIEGDYSSELSTTSQKNSVISIVQQIRKDYPASKSVYGLDELIGGEPNPGILFPLNDVIAQSLGVATEMFRLSPSGAMRYTFQNRTLYFDRKKPVTGSDVKELQILLSYFGYSTEKTGIFDGITLDAVLKFQNDHSITPDGTVGEETFNLIRSLASKYYEKRSTFSRVLSLNANNYQYGEDVKLLQYRLNLLGYTCNEDGFYEETTESAVRDFQQTYLIAVDGRVGPITWSMITSSDANFIKRMIYFTTPMMFGDDIRLVQQRLNDIGFSVGNPSGWYDEITEKAVRDFQQKNMLEVTGRLDEDTSKRLFK